MSLSVPLLTPYFPKYAEEDKEESLHALLSGEVSAIFGGSQPYLQANEEWPRCKTCQHHLIPYLQVNISSTKTPEEFRQRLPPLSPEGATLFQIFICAEETDAGFCFEAWTMHVMEGESWLVRRVHLDPNAEGVDEESEAHDAARAALDEEGQLIPERVIVEWTPGRQETEHEAANEDLNFDDAYYEAHEPADGLKLLGYPIRGKYYYGTSDPYGNCVAGDEGPHFDWRCLVQLGTRDDDNPIYTTGNIFVNQCVQHPDVLEAACSGDW
ncbi:hypothetical protein C8Q77DRAFT_1129218 [Trametes polyzona]|nr:hypothetical protein C8Q77DRAFT_1129218 [Trametes polyzona]